MELLLNKKELLDLGEHVTGMRIVCGHGHCWITQTGDSRDRFLRTGESFALESSGQLIIVAMEPSRLMLTKSRQKQRHIISRILNGELKGSSALAGT